MHRFLSFRTVKLLTWAPCLVVIHDTIGTISIVRERDANLGSELPKGAVMWISRIRPGSFPSRGEIVALTSPSNPRQRLYLRAMALPGDYVRQPTRELSGTRLMVVPQGSVWVEAVGPSLKEGRADDSNVFGPISSSLVYGKVSYTLSRQAGLAAVQRSPPQSSKFIPAVRGFT